MCCSRFPTPLHVCLLWLFGHWWTFVPLMLEPWSAHMEWFSSTILVFGCQQAMPHGMYHWFMCWMLLSFGCPLRLISFDINFSIIVPNLSLISGSCPPLSAHCPPLSWTFVWKAYYMIWRHPRDNKVDEKGVHQKGKWKENKGELWLYFGEGICPPLSWNKSDM